MLFDARWSGRKKERFGEHHLPVKEHDDSSMSDYLSLDASLHSEVDDVRLREERPRAQR
jgi:hypothetical protein